VKVAFELPYFGLEEILETRGFAANVLIQRGGQGLIRLLVTDGRLIAPHRGEIRVRSGQVRGGEPDFFVELQERALELNHVLKNLVERTHRAVL
jgi:hypothetical protein